MRSLKELGQIMLDNTELFETGLCSWTANLFWNKLITDQEEKAIDDLIKKTKPKEQGTCDDISWGFNYHFTFGELEPRIDWINTHLMGKTDEA